MSVSLTPLARQQFNQGGIPLAGGLLFTYAAGTNTKLATYTDATGSTPNTNPIILDANGQCDVWLLDGYAYKFALCPSTDTDPPTNAFWIKDNISNNILPLNPTFGNVTVTGTLAVSGNTTIGGTLNKVTITPPATGAVLTLANNSTLTTVGAFGVSLTATGTTAVTLPTGGTLARTDQATDTFGALTDITTNNVSATAHGFVPKLPNNAMVFFNGIGGYTAAPAQSVIRSPRSSNTILAGGDNASWVDITSGTFTQTFTAAATLGSGWYVFLSNSGTGDITIPSSDGVTNWIMYPGEFRLIQCDGASFNSKVLTGFQRVWTTTGTFIKPPGYASFFMEPVGAGGGGGSGRAAAFSAQCSGGTGGGGGARNPKMVQASAVPSSLTVTIGAAGTGASGVAATSNGAAGGAGGNTSIGTLALAFGGAGGLGGTTSAVLGAGGGGSGSAGASSIGGAPQIATATGASTTGNAISTGGASGGGGNGASGGANSETGGASGGNIIVSPLGVGNGGSSLNAGCGGGAGGSWDATPTAVNGGAGGLSGSVTAGGGGVGGTGTAGAAGTTGASTGAGGGGGAPNTAGVGGKGGDGGAAGDGGGGGGSGTTTSGAGGTGKAGQATITGIQ